MHASLKLLLSAVTIYCVLPLPWIVWRPEGIFYTFNLHLLIEISIIFGVFLAAWSIGAYIGRRQPLFQSSERSKRSAQTIGMWLVFATLCCSTLANGFLFSIDALTIDEITGRPRIPILTALGSAHIFGLIYSACLLFSTEKQERSKWLSLLIAATLLFTIGIGLIEGRRTAVILPLVIYLTLAIISGRTATLKKFLIISPAFVALFGFTTYFRTTGAEDSYLEEDVLFIAGDALVGRIGNALLILDPILDHRKDELNQLDPKTLSALFFNLPHFGLVRPPFETSFGNELGQQLGLLPPENDFTGINSGWIGELILNGGLAAVAIGGVLLGGLATFAWDLLPQSSSPGLFLRVMVVIFVISGFQMEIPFPIISLLRALFIALTLIWLENKICRWRARN